MDMKNTNRDKDQQLNHSNVEHKTTRLADEERWLSNIREAQTDESTFHLNQKNMRIADLRQTYKQQADEKREREKNFIKF